MSNFKKRNDSYKFVLPLFLHVAFLFFSQYFGNRFLILISFLIFLLLIFATKRELLIPVLLFYLPWYPLMKISRDSMTFFTMMFPFLIMYYFLINKEKIIRINKKVLLIVLILVIQTLAVKIFLKQSFQANYLIFFGLLLFIPSYNSTLKNRIDFEKCVVFFFFGAISASIASILGVDNYYISQYVSVFSDGQTVMRMSGFYGDPNYYSAHLLCIIGGLLVILNYGEKINKFVVILCILISVYFGLVSISKMFLFSLALIIFLWVIALLFTDSRMRNKSSIIFGIIILLPAIYISGIYKVFIDQYSSRLGVISDLSTLTTGRSSILILYFDYFKSNIIVLIFGQGYSLGYPSFGSATHNTFIESIYLFGVFGTLLLCIWIFVAFGRASLRNIFDNFGSLNARVALVLSCILPYFAIHYFFRYEFFLFPIVISLGFDYIDSANSKNKFRLKQELSVRGNKAEYMSL